MDNNPNFENNNYGTNNYGTTYNNQYNPPYGAPQNNPYGNDAYNQGNSGYYNSPQYDNYQATGNPGEYNYYQNLYKMFGGYNPIVDKEVAELSRLGMRAGALLIGIFGMQLVFSLLISVLPIADLYSSDITFSMAVGIIAQIIYMLVPCVAVFLTSRAEERKRMNVFNAPKSSKLYVLGVFAGLGLCLIGNSATTMFAAFLDIFGVTFFSGSEDMEIPTSLFSIVVYILNVALVPALFEEFAFRGVVMQPLRKYGDWFAILASAFCFALVHANMVQIPFAFIAGVSLGYFCIKTKSIWTSITIHFLNNFISIIFSVYYEKYPDASILMYYIPILALIIIGIVAMLVFRSNCAIKTKKDATAMNKHKKLKKAAFVSVPTLVIAIGFVSVTSLSLTSVTNGFGMLLLLVGLFVVLFTLFKWIHAIKADKTIKRRGIYTASLVLTIIASVFLPIITLFTMA